MVASTSFWWGGFCSSASGLHWIICVMKGKPGRSHNHSKVTYLWLPKVTTTTYGYQKVTITARGRKKCTFKSPNRKCCHTLFWLLTLSLHCLVMSRLTSHWLGDSAVRRHSLISWCICIVSPCIFWLDSSQNMFCTFIQHCTHTDLFHDYLKGSDTRHFDNTLIADTLVDNKHTHTIKNTIYYICIPISICLPFVLTIDYCRYLTTSLAFCWFICFASE